MKEKNERKKEAEKKSRAEKKKDKGVARKI